MINLFYLFPYDSKRLLRLVFLMVTPGVVIILCHTYAVSPSGYNAQPISLFNNFTGGSSFRSASFRNFDNTPTDRNDVEGPAPEAVDDQATTAEEVPVTIDVLSNDKNGTVIGEDGTVEFFEIDPSTVDLDPERNKIQSSVSTSEGKYSTNESGQVNFVPAPNYFGDHTVNYTVDSKAGERSNVATVSLTVTNVNDVPVITGLREGPLQAQAGKLVVITLDDLIVEDPDNQEPEEFSLTILPGNDYTVSDNAVIPDAGFSGELPVAVQVNDGMAFSETFNVTLNVIQVNVPPVITGQTPDPLTTKEDMAVDIRSHLIVIDPDNSYPADFTIKIEAGSNYTVSGGTVTPAPDFYGSLSFSVTVNDGTSDSAPHTFELLVEAVNDPPVISAQVPLSTAEDQAIALQMSHITVTDPDNTDGFTLEVLSGEDYTFSGTTVTPSANFTGPLTVNIIVNDGTSNSEPFPLQVSVAAANDAPTITGQQALSTAEDVAKAIAWTDLIVADPDNTYPSGFSLLISAGDNYTFSGNIIYPAANYSGTLTVPVQVSDGQAASNVFPLVISVNPVNDAPEITGQTPVQTTEDTPFTIQLSQLTVLDVDNAYPADFTLAVAPGSNYTATGSTITPAKNFTGSLNVSVTVNDGVNNSAPFSFQINVSNANDAPVITGQVAVATDEDKSFTVELGHLTVSDADNAYPTGFTLEVLSGENYTFSGTTVTPSANFTGPLTVNLIVNDGTSNSEPFPLQVSVAAANDAPTITGQQALNTAEDVAKAIAWTDLIVEDPDNTYPSGFSLLISAGDNYTFSGNIIYPAANYSGTLTVPVQVSDGQAASNVFPLVISVTPVNDAPEITGQAPVETTEDTPFTIQLSHLTVLDVDNAYPAGFTLAVAPGSNYTATGSTITPAQNFTGTLNVSVTVNDGVDNSAPFSFQINVSNANDAPVITGQVAVATDEEKSFTVELGHLTVSDADNAYPTGFTLVISPGANYSVTGQTVTPANNFAGVLTVPLQVNDGQNNSGTFNFQLQVNQINDPPSFAPVPNQQISENAPATSLTIKDISKGPLEESQQLTFVVTSSNTTIIENPVIQYNGTGTTAVLSFAVKPNASGVVSITIAAIDNGLNTPPHQNSYTSSFQVEVLEVNTAPTLDVINDLTLMEDAELQNITLTGISAGPGETQALSVTVTSSNADFFERLDVSYMSPAPTALLQFQPRKNVFGTVQLSVTVTDNGSGAAPHVNTVSRSFKILVQPVNDAPVFTSTPVTLAVIGELYEYRITAADLDAEKIIITAPVKPSWAVLNSGPNGEAKLSGTPPDGSVGNVPVTLQVNDAASSVSQSFTIFVNIRPVVSSLSIVTAEDIPTPLQVSFFQNGYADANDNPLTSVSITTVPTSGKLLLSGQEIKASDTIPASSLTTLVYSPNENFFGMDFFGWTASDGYHFSLGASRVDISVLPVNDAPLIRFQNDTLYYEVNGEPDFISPLARIIDPDDDTLTNAVVGFHARNYRPEADVLEFQNTTNIRGTFDFQSGILKLTGRAPLLEYQSALRTVRYLHRNTLDPLLEPKGVYFLVNDGDVESVTKDKIIMLKYTFIEFDIPSGFTPNNDQANDVWVINRPGGGLEEMDDAIISVYNKRGVLVFRTRGFDHPWDGTMNGELLPADTYFFTIDLKLRNRKTYKGIVTLLR